VSQRSSPRPRAPSGDPPEAPPGRHAADSVHEINALLRVPREETTR
jgi:hypothetical protein